MSSKPNKRERAPQEAKAVINRLKISPRKLNLVAQMIRGMKVSDAITQLSFSSKRISNDVRKALQSAIANAENNHNLNVDELRVKEAYVGKSLVMKRFHTRGRGKSAAIKRPYANLTLVVTEAQVVDKKAKAPKAEGKAAKSKAEPKSKAAAKPKSASKAKAAKTEESK
jgi:large subunit ribosomal protein L22